VVLPIHDDNPTRRRPLVTYLLIAINVVAFLMSPVASYVAGSSELAQECRQVAFFDEYAAKPKELLTNDPVPPTTVVNEQGDRVCPLPSYDKEPFLSALTAMFLHGGWLHLLGNLLFLFVFGNNVEDRLGRLRFLGFYLLCGYVATYGFALLDPGSTTSLVGASGAIAGVLGAYLLLYPRARVLTIVLIFPLRLPAWLVLGGWFALQYSNARSAGVAEGAGVAYAAHVIGFVAGAALVWSLRGSTPQPVRRR
jgi:membrane associated rhomboid family serine protease